MIANQGPRRSAAGRSVVRPLPAQFEPGRRSQLARRHAARPRTLRRLARAGAGGRRAAQRRLRRLGLLGRRGPPGHREGGDRARRLLGTVRLVRRGRGGGDRLARRRRSRRGGVGGRRAFAPAKPPSRWESAATNWPPRWIWKGWAPRATRWSPRPDWSITLPPAGA